MYRKNNAVEGWHDVFNFTLVTSKYKLPFLVRKLKVEEEIMRQKSLRLSNGEILQRKL